MAKPEQTKPVQAAPQNKLAALYARRAAAEQELVKIDKEELQLIKTERKPTLALVKQLVAKFKFKPAEIFPELKKSREAKPKTEPVYKYYDAKTGAKWTGHGKSPEPFKTALEGIKAPANRKAAIEQWLISDKNPLPVEATKNKDKAIPLN